MPNCSRRRIISRVSAGLADLSCQAGAAFGHQPCQKRQCCVLCAADGDFPMQLIAAINCQTSHYCPACPYPWFLFLWFLFWCLQVLPRPALLLSFERFLRSALFRRCCLYCSVWLRGRVCCLRFLRHHLYLLSNCLAESLNSVYLRFIPIAKTAYRLELVFSDRVIISRTLWLNNG